MFRPVGLCPVLMFRPVGLCPVLIFRPVGLCPVLIFRPVGLCPVVMFRAYTPMVRPNVYPTPKILDNNRRVTEVDKIMFTYLRLR